MCVGVLCLMTREARLSTRPHRHRIVEARLSKRSPIPQSVMMTCVVCTMCVHVRHHIYLYIHIIIGYVVILIVYQETG